jgi:hypothetical protein
MKLQGAGRILVRPLFFVIMLAYIQTVVLEGAQQK